MCARSDGAGWAEVLRILQYRLSTKDDHLSCCGDQRPSLGPLGGIGYPGVGIFRPGGGVVS